MANMTTGRHLKLSHALLQTVREVLSAETKSSVKKTKKVPPSSKVMVSKGKTGGVRMIDKKKYNANKHVLADEKKEGSKNPRINLSGKQDQVELRPRLTREEVSEKLDNMGISDKKEKVSTANARVDRENARVDREQRLARLMPKLTRRRFRQQFASPKPGLASPKRRMNEDERASDENISEAKGLGKQVMIIKGHHSGKSGWIREIAHHKGVERGKHYHVDLDDGGQANGLAGHEIRLVKKQVTEGNSNSDHDLYHIHNDDADLAIKLHGRSKVLSAITSYGAYHSTTDKGALFKVPKKHSAEFERHMNTMRITPDKSMGESVEMNELSKETLRKYAKRSLYHVSLHTQRAGEKNKQYSSLTKQHHILQAIKRARGVATAIDKLAIAKEEVELGEARRPVVHPIVHHGKVVGSTWKNGPGDHQSVHHASGMSWGSADSRKSSESVVKDHHDGIAAEIAAHKKGRKNRIRM